MTTAEFLDRYSKASVELDQYVAGLPLWVNIWRGWMFVVFTAAILFVFRKSEARWLAAAMVVSIFAYNIVTVFSGVGRFPSIAFVAVWTPLLVFLWRSLPALEKRTAFDRVYVHWVRMSVATLAISLAFDFYNVAHSLLVGTR